MKKKTKKNKSKQKLKKKTRITMVFNQCGSNLLEICGYTELTNMKEHFESAGCVNGLCFS